MNLIDLAVLAFLIGMAWRGYRRGLIQEGGEALAAVAGLVAAGSVSGPWAAAVAVYTGVPEDVGRPVLFAATAVSVAAAGFALAPVVHRLVVERTGRHRADAWGGACFGAAKALVLCAIALALAARIPLGAVSATLDASAAARAVFAVMPAVYRYIGELVPPGP